MKKVRITVLKTEFYPELAERYLTEGREAGPCPLQQVGSYAVTEKYNARFWADGCRYRSQTRRNVYG